MGRWFSKTAQRRFDGRVSGHQGLSHRNIKYIRQWNFFYNREAAIGQQLVAQLVQIPWGHNLAIISKSKSLDEARFYIENTLTHSWSQCVLTYQIESGLWQRKGSALSNFEAVLPSRQSELAPQILKDPYVFDFLTLAEDFKERELELGLLDHMTRCARPATRPLWNTP